MSPRRAVGGVYRVVMAEQQLDDEASYAEHAPRLVALATALAGPSSAEDVVSAAVIRVLGSPGWPDVKNRGAYLTRAVVNEVRTAHRTDLRREARERRAARPDTGEVPSDPVPEIIGALAALPLRQRAVIFLTYWADMTPGAVAAELGISEGSVRQHLTRARRSLRRNLS